jgi:hypothetical protein
MNKLVASQCWSTMQYLLICQPLDTLRFLFDGYPERLCFFLVTFKNSLKAQGLMFRFRKIFLPKKMRKNWLFIDIVDT